MDGSSNATALDRRIAGAMVTSDQQNDPFSSSNRPLEAAVDRRPGLVEIHAVKIEHAVGFD